MELSSRDCSPCGRCYREAAPLLSLLLQTSQVELEVGPGVGPVQSGGLVVVFV